MNKEFIRVRSTKDITLSTIILAAGTVCIVLPLPTSVKIFGFVLFKVRIIYRGEIYDKKEKMCCNASCGWTG